MKLLVVILGIIAASAALPPDDQRYMPMSGDDGVVHTVDTLLKESDIAESDKYQPDTQNLYYLFTRLNPTESQPIVYGSTNLGSTNYNVDWRTIFIIHGWRGSAQGPLYSTLVPAILGVADANVIAVDWSAGAGTLNYIAAVINTFTSGKSVARFVNWLMASTGTTPAQIHIVGHSLGGQQSGIVGRFINGNVSYITALDPAFPGWITNVNKFRASDGAYTEVIHTNAGIEGYPTPLGQVDFYPNCGNNMPGCNGTDSISCNHNRCWHYFAESLSSSFTGTRCATYADALTGNVLLSGSLQMGGLTPKTGNSGIFYLQTNADAPYSRG